MTPPPDSTIDVNAIANAIWYHTIDLPGGTTTPGRYDLRKIVSDLPWPDLRCTRCLDVGSRDGFLAFEMERRGAAEVISLDIEDPTDVDFPAFRPRAELIKQDLDNGSRAFELAARALHSRVQRQSVSVYKLQPQEVGTFDFAVLGTLLLHLRDPVAALTALRGVLTGSLLVNEAVIPSLDLFRRRPVAQAVMFPGHPFWWLANPRGLAQLLVAAGFEVVVSGRPYILPNGPGAPRRRLRQCFRRPLSDIPHNIVQTRGDLHCWILARPALRSRTER
jgi:tRNA (mo5U34)-methyltransferase